MVILPLNSAVYMLYSVGLGQISALRHFHVFEFDESLHH